MRYLIIFSIIGSFCYLITEADDASPKILNLKPTESLMYNFAVRFLKTCYLNLKKVIIYNNVSDQDTFAAFSEIQPQTSVTLLSNIITWKQVAPYRFDDIKINAVMIVIDTKCFWCQIEDILFHWRFQRDCVVYIFPLPLDDCVNYKSIFEFTIRFYIFAAYLVCPMNGRYTSVYTHDPYGNTEPPHWNKISQNVIWGKNWTFYKRSYQKDVGELCLGFYFERTDPTNKTSPILGLHHKQIKEQSMRKVDKLYDDKIEKYLTYDYPKQVHNLKRLLKLKFQYYTPNSSTSESMLTDAYYFTEIDTIIFRKSHKIKMILTWNFFYPVNYDPYVIVSHNRGLMTPVEKIAKFYGVLTLSSLTILMIITFIVIWLSTGKMSLAVFDVIRLLINAEINVPINNRWRKIFFCIIFLYFLIIHATFSGHLAEFLTAVDYRRNVDTIEDLKDPRIEKIYYFGYRFDEGREFDVLRQKSERIMLSSQCYRIKKHYSSVCIVPLSRALIMKEWESTFHMSKNTLGFAWRSNVYRPGFPLYENFNWAIMFLFDTQIINHDANVDDQNVFRKIEKQIVMDHVSFRSIRIGDLDFAFVLLIFGNCAGFICFLFEIGVTIVSNRLNNHRKNGIIVVKPLEFS